MRAIVTGIVLAASLAVGAAFILNSEVQRPTSERFSTEAVRL